MHPTYTPAQLRAFYAHIDLPTAWRYATLSSLPSQTPAAHLEFLETLMRYASVAIPFENLTLHYSLHKVVVIDPEVLFDKVVGDIENDGNGSGKASFATAETNGTVEKKKKSHRGGYCMENNLLLGTVLRTVGFKVRSVGGRVWEPNKSLTAWGHMVNLVRIGDKKYAVDIGFGSFGPVRPVPLPDKQMGVPDAKRVWPTHPHAAPAEMRLVWRSPRQYTEDLEFRETTAETAEDDADETLKLWAYETRPGPDKAWRPNYCFTEVEFYPRDYGAMNLGTSTNRTSIFVKVIMTVRMVFRREVQELCRLAREECGTGANVVGMLYQDDSWEGPGDEIVGQIILVENVKLRVRDKTAIVQKQFEKEQDRTDALERWFSIYLSAAEKRGIRSLVTELAG